MDKSQEIHSNIIYKFTNNINGHSYIEQTINPKSRYQDHICRVKKNTGLETAIAKYGAEISRMRYYMKYQNFHVVK